MATKRTPLHRDRKHPITPDAIAAWLAGDYVALHRALGLKPWQPSPLPSWLTPLGVSEATAAARRAGPRGATVWDLNIGHALALQRGLVDLAGWPPEGGRLMSDRSRMRDS